MKHCSSPASKSSRKGSGALALLGLSFFLVAAAPSAGPSAVAVTAAPSPAPAAALAPAQAKGLLKEFQRAQSMELKALEHRYKLELKELKSVHSARKKEWLAQEQEARHKFFAEHTKGPDRRAYVKDFISRRIAFERMLKDEAANRANEQQVRLSSVKSDQAARLKEFQVAIAKGEQPPHGLWPAGN